MKYLIYDLFSGVGYCNQLFSLETAIYLANISKRKLILLIRYPLCHCGRSSWEYGHILDFFKTDYMQFLPYGIEVYYKDIPYSVNKIIRDQNTKKNIFCERLSGIGIIDKQILEDYSNDLSNDKIVTFLHNRKPVILDLDTWVEEYVHISESNASRCFYNFLTNDKNYKLMSDICFALTKLKDGINIIFNKFTLPEKYYSFHFRFGDKRHSKSYIDNVANNKFNLIVSKITKYNYKNIIIMCDRKDSDIILKLTQYCKDNNINILYSDSFINNIDKKELNRHFPNVSDYEVIKFLIEKQICNNSEIFTGWHFSTVSNYIQYNNFLNNKPHNLYVEGDVVKHDNKYSWISSKIFGASIAFKCFFKDNIKINMNNNETKLITLTNDGYLNMTKNLLISMTKLGIEQTLKIYCIGSKSYNYFKERYPENEIEIIDFADSHLHNWVEYKALQNPDVKGKELWADITSYKMYAMNKELKTGKNIIFTDGDIVFEKNPFPYIFENISNDLELFIQNDEQSIEWANWCTGFFWMKSNKNTINITDFTTIRKNIEHFQNDQQYLRRYSKKIKFKYFDLDLFPNGKYFREKKPKSPYIIHFNYDTGVHKINRMKMFKKWYVDNENQYVKKLVNETYISKNPISKYLKSKNISLKQGSICEFEEKENFILDSINKNIKNVLEIGFLAGHSANLFLKLNKDIKVTSIDQLHLQSVRPGLEWININYPNRHTFIKGESSDILSKDVVKDKFDCILIDGSFKFDDVHQDIILCKKYSHKNTILIVNSVIKNKSLEKYWTVGPTTAWNKLLNIHVSQIKQLDISSGNSIVVGKYIF